MSFSDFLKALCEFYKDHKTAPGVHIAWLPDEQEFYASVHVFPKGIASRTIVSKRRNADMSQCLGDLHAQWMVDRDTPLPTK